MKNLVWLMIIIILSGFVFAEGVSRVGSTGAIGGDNSTDVDKPKIQPRMNSGAAANPVHPGKPKLHASSVKDRVNVRASGANIGITPQRAKTFLENKGINVTNLSKDDVKKFAAIKNLNITKEQIVERLKNMNVKKVNVKEFLSKRNISQDDLKHAKDKFKTKAQKSLNTREKFNVGKEKVEVNLGKLKECNNSESEECILLKEEMMVLAKEMTQGAIDTALTHLEKMTSYVESSETLNEEIIGRIKTHLDDYMVRLSELTGELELTRSKDEVKNIAKEVKSIISKMRGFGSRAEMQEKKSNALSIVRNAEYTGLHLQCILDKLEESDIDVADLKVDLDEFYNYIETVKPIVDSIRNKVGEDLTNITDEIDVEVEETMNEVNGEISEQVKMAHEEIKKAQDLLITMKKAIMELDTDKVAFQACKMADKVEVVVNENGEETLVSVAEEVA